MPVRPLLLLLVSLFASSARAADGGPPRFLIDSVSVKGARAGVHRIVVAESAIEGGNAYTEAELRDAISRVNRLPFVVHSDLQLEKGSARDHYILVISIIEAKPLFASLESSPVTADTREIVGTLVHPETGAHVPILRDRSDRRDEQHGTVGARWFVGSKAMAHVSADYDGDAGANIGYTLYDVLGTRATLSLVAAYRDPDVRLPPPSFEASGRPTISAGDRLGWQVTGALPLSGNHALRVSWLRRTLPFVYNRVDPIFDFDGRLHIDRLHLDEQEVAWLYDTTNDPIFPTLGTRLRTSAGAHRELHFLPGPTGFTYDVDFKRVADYAASAAKYWALTPSQSVFGSADVQVRSNGRIRDAAARAGYAMRVWMREDSDRFDELRLFAEIEMKRVDAGSVQRYRIAHTGVSFRNAWGVIRLDFTTDWGRRP